MQDITGKKVLITGANGFIGSHLVDRLIEDGSSVYPIVGPGLNRLRVVSVKLDITNFDSVKRYFVSVKPDIVYHLGAFVNLSRDFEVGITCINTNILGTLNVLEASVAAGVEYFVFFSTQEVYGDTAVPYKEDHKLAPPSPYAVSKVAGEDFCSMYKTLHNLDYTIFRLSTVYGPGQVNGGFIPTVVKKALMGAEIHLNSGKKKRDYVYIDDLVDCAVQALSNEMSKGQVFNVGGGVSYSLKDLVGKIVELSESRSPILLNKFPDRIGEADNMLSDISKAKKLLDWKPKYSLDAGLKKTIEFYRRYYGSQG